MRLFKWNVIRFNEMNSILFYIGFHDIILVIFESHKCMFWQVTLHTCINSLVYFLKIFIFVYFSGIWHFIVFNLSASVRISSYQMYYFSIMFCKINNKYSHMRVHCTWYMILYTVKTWTYLSGLDRKSPLNWITFIYFMAFVVVWVH